jgi:CHAT domain-containing protein/tetratricopeptide (TPR) repeat protein
LGPNHSLTATVLDNQGTLAMYMGDVTAAGRLFQRAIRIWSASLGSSHPYVARGLDDFAQVFATRQPRRARDLYQRALSIRRSSLGPDHPDVAWTLTNLAKVTAADGDLANAAERINEALRIYRRGGLPQEPDHLARALELRGIIEMRRSQFEAARTTFGEALTTRQGLFGLNHPLVASARAQIASAELAIGNSGLAVRSALEAESTGLDHLRFTIRYLPERQAMAYAAARPRGLDLALSVPSSPPESDRVLDMAIRTRGVILDELAARAKTASANDDPEVAALNRTMLAARQRFATLMLRSIQGEEAVPISSLDAARQQKEDAEQALVERSGAAREEAERAQAGLEDVRRAMPSGSALISFIRYDRTSFANGPTGRTVTTTPSYIALVTRADTVDVKVIPLGTATSIERLVNAWRAEAGGRAIAVGVEPREAERMYRAAGISLRRRVWDPLVESLEGASRIFIVPDGALNLVSFAALPVGTRYLLESGLTIHYLSTERDLVRTAGAEGHGLLALGGPAFDTRTSAPGGTALRSGCGAIGSLRFEDLPGSRAEVRDIARIWGDENDVLMLSGRAATKAALTKAIVGRKVVHLATHGFFLGADCAAPIPRTRGVGGIVAAAAVPVDNPLLLSGLALAGVNALSGARQSNAILNAEEIAGLNLQGTEWVVLSACDTGLGQITSGEGVFGLRRALQIAGVHTIIMSLWSVEDQSTRDWMKALYAARLTKQLDTPDAVRAASLQLLEQRRKRNLSTHPFYWAAFVAAGDWR